MAIQKQEGQSGQKGFSYLAFAFGEASKITFSLVFYPIVLLLIGVWVDRHYGTKPLFIIIGIILGLVIALFQAMRVRQKEFKK